MTALRILAAAALVALVAGAGRSDVGPLGPEFQANTYTTGYQSGSSVAAAPGGGFVVVWSSNDRYYSSTGQDGDRAGVFGQRFDASGAPTGPEFQVNTYTTGTQNLARVTADAAGNFTVVWQSGGDYGFRSQPDGSASGVFLRRFDAAGTPLTDEQQVNTFTRGQQQNPDLAIDTAGDTFVVWQSGGGYPGPITQDGDRRGVFAQGFDPSGMPVGDEVQVNTYTTGEQTNPAVAADGPGRFVVVWESGGYYGEQDGSDSGVFGRRFAADGTPLSGEFQVNTYTTADQDYPAVASDPAGNFVVVWRSRFYYGNSQDGDRSGVFGQRFDASGLKVGPEFQVNTVTSGDQMEPQVATDPDGNFVVAWASFPYFNDSPGGDGDGAAVIVQHFAPDGTKLGDEEVVNTYTTGTQRTPAIAGTGDGNFVVTWTSGYYASQDGDESGIFGQRLRTTALTNPERLDGTKLVLKDDPQDARKRRLVVRSSDADVDPGLGDGTRDDPTLTGGSLHVQSAFFDATYDLPAANWRSLGPGKGWDYRDSEMLAGPITAARVRGGRVVRVRGKGAQLDHELATNPNPVLVTLRTGEIGQRFCARFGGEATFKPGALYRAAEAPAPTSCR